MMVMKLKTLLDVDWSGKIVLVRTDYNVPVAQQPNQVYKVADPRRIEASFYTISSLLANNNKVVLLSHFGRPTPNNKAKFSLAPVFAYLKTHTDWHLEFIDDYTDPLAVRAKINASLPRSVFLLENVRFLSGEETGSNEVVKLLAKIGDAFVGDAFSVAHRDHASVCGLAKALPSVAGVALAQEVKAFGDLLSHPTHPFVVIVGGAKIADKIEPIVNLAKVADAILIGGGVANNFLKAVGLEIQKSYLQDTPIQLRQRGIDYVEVADNIVADNLAYRFLKDNYIPLPKIIYPVDVIAANSLESSRTRVVDLVDKDRICQRCEQMYLDIGPKTSKLYRELIMQAETVFWNGPMGVFEKPAFAKGTREVARAMAKSSALTLVGGGDTIDALDRFGYFKNIDYVSMAGSAALDFLSGKTLPGVAVFSRGK